MSLSLLSMCERGFKRLQECWECYSDKLTESGVYQPLLSITAKLRRGAKPQFKVLHAPLFPSRQVFICDVTFVFTDGGSMFLQAQVDEFEKRLTAVHTRGLENVESPEMDENEKQGESTQKTVMCTPLSTRGRPRTKRGQCSLDFTVKGPVQICMQINSWFYFMIKRHFPVFVTGQVKPSVSSRDGDSFVTPQKSRKSKKPVITFSSDEEEEDEEGECILFILYNLSVVWNLTWFSFMQLNKNNIEITFN